MPNKNLTKECVCVKKLIGLVLSLVCVLGLGGCGQQQNLSEENNDKPNYDELQESSDTVVDTSGAYTYEELSEMPAKELLDLFIQNGLVINNDLKASFTEEELQTLFKEHFDMWHTGVSVMGHTMYIDLAYQTKAIYDKITETKK